MAVTDTLQHYRDNIRGAYCADEHKTVAGLLDTCRLGAEAREQIRSDAIQLVEQCRGQSDRAGTLDAFLQEFGLSNKEGIALMCLAESLLRVPDQETADKLIAEKILSGDWAAHKGKSGSRFVNASVWGLMLTGRIVHLDDEITGDTASWMKKLVSGMGEPVVRRAVLQAMKIMGGQYVLGRTIEEGVQKGVAGNRPGTRFSFDMLGEGARTDADAQRYYDAYAQAIECIVRLGSREGVIQSDGISVKLSALHPRYEYRQKRRVVAELLPRVKALALMAKQGNIGFSIDAEEADRLDLSLDLFEALARDPDLRGWDGLGFVLQAYQKRAVEVARWLIALAESAQRRLMVRLVKGAYWDGEIKHAQEMGLADYPVFTRKCHTDLSYQVCAQVLLSAPEDIFPQFATHNAHTVALVQALAPDPAAFEFQRLHGMGHLLYDQVQEASPQTVIRVYAPVGNHRDLLPYLVRRLLENGANSSFVNRFLDAQVPAAELITDQVDLTRSAHPYRHTRIPLPIDLYQQANVPWQNSRGIDLADPVAVSPLLEAMAAGVRPDALAGPVIGGERKPGDTTLVISPADHGVQVGKVIDASPAQVTEAMARAYAAQPAWDALGIDARAACLERAADLLEQECESLMGLIVAEAGRTIDDALSEVREAVDFCRYYARQGQHSLRGDDHLPGPTGEDNRLSLHGRGVFLCISPWNFPLAIFAGQVVAALVAGNSVVAKPAEQTPLIAARAVDILHRAGVPGDALQLLPGDGAMVGGAAVRDPHLAGVAFTGSTATAKLINRQLAERDGPILPLIAETGGLNVMLVDSTALPEQVVDDVISSAFQSAGQRCSALRVLYLQEDVADNIITMLRGAMAELKLGDPAALSTDIGPVIDLDARQMLERHEQRMQREGKLLASCELDAAHREGNFFAPQVYEIEKLGQLEREVFGPILHVIRYKVADLPRIYDDINASGYGLTLGVHSRIDAFAREVFRATHVGNTYINRNMVGAVPGVNPFGGHGLSGTGPKAGGPNYLLRFATERTLTENVVARGGNTQLFGLEE
ncbi:bifunctional proline dehydrogenase/L-glutamate gamma-semialdehyde dehydrogenase [Halioglobus sp. HI00S01]|nr:bifunctional proline dehydrogenase/L-glutamate gamma-semialdehyde dehydrogenase [Halioglobus sp. HI00S01]